MGVRAGDKAFEQADPAGASPGDAAALTSRGLRENYVQFQYHSVQFLTEHLADCSRVFKGDLQQMIVLALIGQVALNVRLRSPGTDDNGAISASRLADVAGIPRETVRRKLVALKDRGWIEQVEGGSWRLCGSLAQTPAREDLKDLDERGLQRWARFLSNVKPLI